MCRAGNSRSKYTKNVSWRAESLFEIFSQLPVEKINFVIVRIILDGHHNYALKMIFPGARLWHKAASSEYCMS